MDEMKHLKTVIGFLLAISYLIFSSIPVGALGSSFGSSDYYLYRESAGRPYFKWYNDVDCKAGVNSYPLSGFIPGRPKPLRVYDSSACNSYIPTLPAGSIIELSLVTRNLQFDSQVYTDNNNRFLKVTLDSFDNAGSYDYWTIYLYNQSTISNAYIYVSQYWVPYSSQSDVSFGVNNWTVWAPSSGTPDYSSALNTINNSLNNVNSSIQGVISGVGGVEDSVNDLKDQDQQHWDDENNTTTGAQDSAESDADSAVSDTETATASLFDVITSVVGAITNASATNCNIDMSSLPLGLGSVDVCDFPVPTFITVIGSILAIVILVPIALSVLRDIIGLLESFTR